MECIAIGLENINRHIVNAIVGLHRTVRKHILYVFKCMREVTSTRTACVFANNAYKHYTHEVSVSVDVMDLNLQASAIIRYSKN